MMKAQQGALDLVRFAALSTSVHADAVECSVDDIRRVLIQMSVDEDQMCCLERELEVLQRKQERLCAMRNAVQSSRRERVEGAVLRHAMTPSLQELPKTAIRSSLTGEKKVSGNPSSDREKISSHASVEPGRKGSIRDILRAASAAIEGSEKAHRGLTRQSKMNPSSQTTSLEPRETCNDEREAVCSDIDRQVEELKSRMRVLDSMSIRTKLLELETHKQRARGVNANAIIKTYVESFTFADEVEQLWHGEEVEEYTHVSRQQPSNRVWSESNTSARSEYSGPQSNACSSTGHVIDHTNLDLLIARACQRFAGRCEYLFEQLARTDAKREVDVMHVFSSLLYASEIGTGRNVDVAAVARLQALEACSLLDFYEGKRRASVVDAAVADGFTTNHGSILSNFEHCVLPASWLAPSDMMDVPQGVLLPPARHILTPRFSFSNAQEYKELEAIRVAIQRARLWNIVDVCEALPDVLCPASDMDVDVAEARMATCSTKGKCSRHVWATIAGNPLSGDPTQ